MGMSDSLNELAQKNTQFRGFVDAQKESLQKLADPELQHLTAQTQDYYAAGGWDDAESLVTGVLLHLSAASEWSLSDVSDKTKNAFAGIFGGLVPEGMRAPEQKGTVKAAVAKLKPMGVLITAAALAPIESAFVGFAAGNQTASQTTYSTSELGPGLTLFLGVIENEVVRSEYLKDAVVADAFVFDARFSIKKAGDISAFDQKAALSAMVDVQKAIAGKCDAAMNAIDGGGDDLDLKLSMLRAVQIMTITQSSNLSNEIKKL